MPTFLQLAPEFQLPWHLWLLALFAGSVAGFSKAGIKGIGIIIVTIMAIVFGGKASTGIVLPLFIAGDIIAVWYYDRHAQWKYIIKLMPWMVIGVLVGVWVGKDLPEVLFKRGMAVIILISVAMMVWWERRKIQRVPDNHCGTPGTITMEIAEAGLHTIQFSMREDGVAFDKWIMTTDTLLVPVD